MSECVFILLVAIVFAGPVIAAWLTGRAESAAIARGELEPGPGEWMLRALTVLATLLLIMAPAVIVMAFVLLFMTAD